MMIGRDVGICGIPMSGMASMGGNTANVMIVSMGGNTSNVTGSVDQVSPHH